MRTITREDPSVAAEPAEARPRASTLRIVEIGYRSHSGRVRRATVVVPADYAKGRDGAIPLVISPHGRGLDGRSNAALWDHLPALGRFAVGSPDGHGRRLPAFSWGAPGQIADLARMPGIVELRLPWLELDERSIYAYGGSMGGQEVLLLAGRHPRLLAGVAAFDAVADLARQYDNFPRLDCDPACVRRWAEPIGIGLQALAREEVGGSPRTSAPRYAARSPIAFAARIAASCVAVQLWWSSADRVVIEPANQSGRLLAELGRRRARGGVRGFVGTWIHTAAFRGDSRLPHALAHFGLIPRRSVVWPSALRRATPVRRSVSCDR